MTNPQAQTTVETLRWRSERLELIDQRVLPAQIECVACDSAASVAQAIRGMVVRGAPAIGCAAAYGVALEALRHRDAGVEPFRAAMAQAFEVLAASRPTAVNLFWALARMRSLIRQSAELLPPELADALLALAHEILAEDVRINRAMGAHGAALLADGARVLTHCNAGALATGGHGTALGVIRAGVSAGRIARVFAGETRPWLQGARLTAWELTQYGISFDIIVDGAAGYFLQRGDVQKVMFGADRVAANGDVANKIGTYMLALAAEANRVPVICVAPSSSIDLQIPDGSYIPIEERDPSEVLDLEKNGEPVVPRGAPARNPAFDITPHQLISAIVTEFGITRSPYDQTLAKALGNQCLSNNPARHSGEQENPIQ